MTPIQFKQHIRQSISNEALQIALDNNAQRRAQGRATAFASLPDWPERRQRAHAVRAEVIGQLDEYLDRFVANVERNGIVVHRAQDAAEAVRMVLEIMGAGKKLIAKSKSMVSEEIELNHALEAAGHRVVETDLGEYIVQLRGEKPAHIITPAVHLRRQEVGGLFQEKLGIPYTEDISTLTNTARRVLREVFLTADVGISGVNFGVADTGTLCIVTNEGNGRMVTTMPPVHIALMGMERIVPTLADLALMLSLLPRSATGQKLSVYTQLIHSPRRADELDGAPERHLVIVDNGRSRLVHSALQEALYCIRCGACLNACPVFRELSGHAYVGQDGSIAPYPGPIGSIVSPGLLGLEPFGHLAQASSLCGACKQACPVDIDLPKLLTRVRAGNPTQKTPKQDGVGLSWMSKVGLKAYGRIAASPRLFALSQKVAGIGTSLLSPRARWLWMPSWTGWGSSKDFPRFAVKPFRERFQHAAAGPTEILSTRKDEVKDVGTARTPSVNLTERFAQELEAVGGHAYLVTQEELSKRLIALLNEREVKAVMMWDSIPPLDEVNFVKAGIRVERRADPKIRAGLTGALSGIAETGTLVIPAGSGRPLSASLLAETHVAVLRSAQIVESLEQALQREEVQKASALALITGPSRTADIEMTLTIGVHGPKELFAFIL
ncbi:MAG TPA: LUD domain-containing protein [Anaerolineales bacterium]|nr:LUD domain-containing protein [Anaerolineales bacterium]